MHRAHFKAIASVVATLRKSSISVRELVNFVHHLANELSRFNEHFDRSKFIDACIGLTIQEVDELMQECDDQEWEGHQVCSDCDIDLEPHEVATSQNPPHRVLCNQCATTEAVADYYASIK